MAYTFTHHDTHWHELDGSWWFWLTFASVMLLILIYALIDSGSLLNDALVTIEEMVP
jgi:uncharacterized protein involved in exopolysaccharide biosynthesis